jgi:hypothetical protein
MIPREFVTSGQRGLGIASAAPTRSIYRPALVGACALQNGASRLDTAPQTTFTTCPSKVLFAIAPHGAKVAKESRQRERGRSSLLLRCIMVPNELSLRVSAAEPTVTALCRRSQRLPNASAGNVESHGKLCFQRSQIPEGICPVRRPHLSGSRVSTPCVCVGKPLTYVSGTWRNTLLRV